MTVKHLAIIVAVVGGVVAYFGIYNFLEKRIRRHAGGGIFGQVIAPRLAAGLLSLPLLLWWIFLSLVW